MYLADCRGVGGVDRLLAAMRTNDPGGLVCIDGRLVLN